MQSWHENIPQELESRDTNGANYDPRSKVELNMYYHSIQMILYRPFLCGFDIPLQSDQSRWFNHHAGRSCVFAALDLLALLPDVPAADEVYEYLPWWNLLHYLCQTSSILALELCLRMQHFEPTYAGILMRHFEKAARYVRLLAENSLSAFKAWRIIEKFGKVIGIQYGLDNMHRIPELRQIPHGWSDADELRLIEALRCEN
jgi:hypothetical protein